MSRRVCATGHIKDPVPLIEKRRGLSPGGRFPPSFIHQVIIITGPNKLYDCIYIYICSRPEYGFRCRQGVKPPLKLKKSLKEREREREGKGEERKIVREREREGEKERGRERSRFVYYGCLATNTMTR